MDLALLSDESLLRYYEAIRTQVAADAKLNGRRRLTGQTAKDRADALLAEIRLRRLQVLPIDWSD